MKTSYLKILSIFIVVFIFIAISWSVRLDLFGADKLKDEIVSNTAKKKIDQIFYEKKADQIDSVMRLKAEKYAFNGNVLVAFRGSCIYNESFGYSDLNNRKELKKDDIFQLASISKQFTAMAVMILKEKAVLSYDDLVTKYIPEFPYPEISIRMLLNHTSGLPNYMWLVEHHWKGKKAPYNSDVTNMIAEHKLPLYFTPGKRWDYSNTGYIILAYIVELVSDQNFADFMHENIFEPLEMNNSFIYSSSLDQSLKHHLTGYYYRGKRYRMIPETINDGTVGDKGVYSTTEDLFKWDQALYSGLLVTKETLNEATSTFKLRDKYEIPYGFGFRISTRNDKKIVYHHGRWNGFRTSLLRYVEDTNTVIVLNHTSSSLNNIIIKEIQQILDDSIEIDLTHKVVNSIIDFGLDKTVEIYFKSSYGKMALLDTVKIAQASQILFRSNNPVNAQRLLLFKDLYKSGELDTNVMNDKSLLKAISLKRKYE